MGRRAVADAGRTAPELDQLLDQAKRNTIKPEQARMAARRFLLSGQLDPSISWEEM